MNESVIKLVDAIKSGDALATENAFADAMAEKLSGKIEDLRVNIAQNMFAQNQEEQFSEEADLAEIVENATDDFDTDEISLSEEEVADLVEKYEGFKKLSGELAAKGAKNPKGLAAWIGRKKYGKEKFQAAAAADHKMKNEEVENVEEGLGKTLAKVAKGTASAVGNVIGGVAKTVGAVRQTPAAIGAAYNRGRAGAQKAIDK